MHLRTRTQNNQLIIIIIIIVASVVSASSRLGGTSLVSRLSACLTEANWWRLMGLLQLRFERDSSTIQHPTRSYVFSSNNEHVNSFALL